MLKLRIVYESIQTNNLLTGPDSSSGLHQARSALREPSRPSMGDWHQYQQNSTDNPPRNQRGIPGDHFSKASVLQIDLVRKVVGWILSSTGKGDRSLRFHPVRDWSLSPTGHES